MKMNFYKMNLLYLILLFGCTSINFTQTTLKRNPSSITGIEKESCLRALSSFLDVNSNSVEVETLENALNYKYTGKDLSAMKLGIESTYFVDYEHTALHLNKIYNGDTTLRNSDHPYQYNGEKKLLRAAIGGKQNRKSWSEPAIHNYMETRSYLMEEKPDFNFDEYLRAHASMMKDGIESVREDQLGSVRKEYWYGNEMGSGISEKALKNIEYNPYLTFEKAPAEGMGYMAEEGKVRGKIHYPQVEKLSDTAKERLEAFAPETAAKVKKIQERNVKATPELIEEVVRKLSEERFDFFAKEREKIGAIDTIEKAEEYIELVAQLQRDIVSIHPTPNGNGRTSRVFALNYALMKEGLPPARLAFPSNDLYMSDEEWAQQVKEGILNTIRLYKDLNYRVSSGIPLEGSPQLAFPSAPKFTDIDYKKYSSPDKIEDYTNAAVDIGQYAQYLEQAKALNGNTRITKEQLAKINKDFEEFFKKNNIFYRHKKEGDQLVSLNFADTDFRTSFGSRSYRSKETYDYKMDRWYSEDIVWRGLSRKNQEIQEEEIIGMFESFHTQILSNNVVRKVNGNSSQQQIRDAIFTDFKQYNDDLYSQNGKLVQMAKDHSETGPLYGQSYGYSTSKNRTVGKAFAMGAMVIAEYGQHHELQHLLKSRVLIGMRRAKKDVDLGRLKQVRNDFSYMYGRQQEVMGIGGADPDSVMTVQLIDEEGKTIKTYVRDVNDPKRILLLDGDVEDFYNIDESKIEKVIELTSDDPNIQLISMFIDLEFQATA